MKHTQDFGNNKDVKELVARLSYFRVKRNLSAREVSLRLGYTGSWFYRVEAGQINLNTTTLFALMELFEITPEELFYYKVEKYDEDKELLSIIKDMTKEQKDALCQVVKIKK